MDLLIEVFAVIAVFSAVHERVLEAIRSLAKPFPRATKELDQLTIGGLGWLPAVALALATRANLFALFPSNGGTPKGANGFFLEYLNYKYSNAQVRDFSDLVRLVLGCVLMGLMTTFGSQFWHDLVKAMMDLRTGLKSLPEATRKLAAPQVSTALAGAASELAGHSDASVRRVAEALKEAAGTTATRRPAHETVTTQLISNALVQAADQLALVGGSPGPQEPVAKAFLKAAAKVQQGA